MKIKSYVYKDIAEDKAIEAGYFKTTEFWDDNCKVNTIDNLSDVLMGRDTLVCYYSGSFGFFHDGHLDVIKRTYEDALKITDDFIIVLSFANSEYSFSKYGNSSFSSNYDRYQRVNEYRDLLSKYNVVIDLNPMLNYRVDHNFTDLLYDFLIKNISEDVFDITNTPVIIGGKDKNYSILNKLTSQVKFWYYDEKIEKSTSKDYLIKEKEKVSLFIRVHNKEEYKIFQCHMKNYYSKIIPIYISDEIMELNRLLKNEKKVITVCKDYSDLFEYIELKRIFDNPLSNPRHDISNKEKFIKYKGYTVVDSDAFSGGTRKFLQSCGLIFISLIDLSDSENTDLIDIDDIKNENFNYPYVDLSYRCSLPGFTPELHDIIIQLKNDLNFIGKNNDI
jgi:glycerol-3-phosphate cytidylyltransferase-like family protein